MKKSIIVLFLLTSLLYSKSSVWKIEKGNDVIYVGGTIHILKKSDYPLPKEFEKAYGKSDKIYFETDLNAPLQQDFQKKLLMKMQLENGKKLSTVLSATTYKRLKEFVSSYNLKIENFEQFKPIMVIQTLTMVELQRIGVNMPGVDYYFNMRALNDGKKVGKLETVDAQLTFLSDMGKGNEDNLVNKSLDDFKKTGELVGDITRFWKNGDEEKLGEFFLKEMKNKYPKVYQTLLVDRNNDWLPIIKSMFGNDEKEFVLVGTAHLLGQDGIIEKLKKEGYKIERFD